jgi:hypothetical protein
MHMVTQGVGKNICSLPQMILGCACTKRTGFVPFRKQSLDHLNHDFSCAMIVTSDDEGTIKIFLKRSPLSDSVIIMPSGT